MTKRKGPPPKPPSGPKRPADKAFDEWLNRGLHQLFDEIAKEPIPEDLIRLIEDDREK